MKSAIHRLFLGRSICCAVCGNYRFCQHEDNELRGEVCLQCVHHLASAENLLHSWGLTHATEWDEGM